jgi:subtilisin family serine protease
MLDGPVAANHPDLASDYIRRLSVDQDGTCRELSSVACQHGTFIAGMLCARRESSAPGICPHCTLLVRPVFFETADRLSRLPSATPLELARAIVECIDAGARVLNLSVALAHPSSSDLRELGEALTYAARRGAIVVAAAGNQGLIASSPITRHPAVIPVVAYTIQGQLVDHSNLGRAVGRNGLGAPGEGIAGLGPEGKPLTMSGTSVAVPFVTGTIALLWSVFPTATATAVRLAVTRGRAASSRTIVPPLLDAWAAYQTMTQVASGR